MAAIIEKKKERGGRWQKRKDEREPEALPLFPLPIVPHGLFFNFFSLFSPQPIIRAIQYLQQDKWRKFSVVLYASLWPANRRHI